MIIVKTLPRKRSDTGVFIQTLPGNNLIHTLPSKDPVLVIVQTFNSYRSDITWQRSDTGYCPGFP